MLFLRPPLLLYFPNFNLTDRLITKGNVSKTLRKDKLPLAKSKLYHKNFSITYTDFKGWSWSEPCENEMRVAVLERKNIAAMKTGALHLLWSDACFIPEYRDTILPYCVRLCFRVPQLNFAFTSTLPSKHSYHSYNVWQTLFERYAMTKRSLSEVYH